MRQPAGPLPWRHVVVYADGREDSAIGLQRALTLAEEARGRVTALDTVDGLPSRLPAELAALSLDDLVATACGARREELTARVAELGARVPIDVVVRPGVAGLELIRHALRTDADLIVKTALGRDVRRMTTFGSTALHLVRKSPTPVLLQNPDYGQYRRVLAAVNLAVDSADRERLARRIVATADQLAKVDAAELHVLYVADAARDRLYRSILSPAQFQTYAHASLRAARELLQRFVSSEAPGALAHLYQGEPADVISGFVRDHKIDLVVMGSLGRSGVAGLLIGELAEELLCRVNCSVLTLKPEGFVTPIAV